jgi:hypothetical protein
VSTAVQTTGGQALRELYWRYRRLALAAGAALLLEEDPSADLLEQAARLRDDARSLAGGARSGRFAACAAAAAELQLLLAGCREQPDAPPLLRLRRVRATHSRLRQEVWDLFPCEYVPCGHQSPPVKERT